MAKKITKSNIENHGSSREDQMMVLLENMRDEIKLVAEGNMMLGEKMDREFAAVREEMKSEVGGLRGEIGGLRQEMKSGFNEVNNRLDGVENRLDGVENRLDGVESELGSMKNEMRTGFKILIAESAKHDREIDQKADKKDLIVLAARVTKLETAK